MAARERKDFLRRTISVKPAIGAKEYLVALALVAVGPGGAAISRDDGRTWTTLSAQGYWAVGAAGKVAWMVGPAGRIIRVTF